MHTLYKSVLMTVQFYIAIIIIYHGYSMCIKVIDSKVAVTARLCIAIYTYLSCTYMHIRSIYTITGKQHVLIMAM